MDSINGTNETTNEVKENTVNEKIENTVVETKEKKEPVVETKEKKMKKEKKAKKTTYVPADYQVDGHDIVLRHTGGRGRPTEGYMVKKGAVNIFVPLRKKAEKHETGAMVKTNGETHDGRPLFKKVSNTRGRPALFTKEGDEYTPYKRPVVKKEKVVVTAEVPPATDTPPAPETPANAPAEGQTGFVYINPAVS